MNFKKDIKLLAYIQAFIAILMLLPMGVSLYYHEMQGFKGFAITIGAMLAYSGIVILALRKTEIKNLQQRDGYFFVTFTWINATLSGALPLIISGDFNSYSSACFEIMSGFTTTGATTLTNIEACQKGILFWRSMTNWLGGMGIVVLFVALLPALGGGGSTFHLVGAESAGPIKGKLTPKMQTTALVLWVIYFIMTLLEIGLLLLGGLSLYEATTVTFSTVSAAGFCVKNASIGAFGSSYVNIVVTIFMLMAGTNFSIYYKAFTGKIKQVTHDTELRVFLGIWLVATIFGALQLTVKHVYPIGEAFMHMGFQVASVITTTGFSTADYMLWPAFALFLVVLMMFIGGCAGSAGGGIKVIRIATLTKVGVQSLQKRIHPTGVFKIRHGEDIYHDDTVMGIAAFFVVYIMTWLIGALIVSLSGVDLETCLASSLTALGNIGIAFGKVVGPTGNFASFPWWTKWVFSFLMLAGRLELFTVYVLFSRTFWKR